jgi:hypothetical protein
MPQKIKMTHIIGGSPEDQAALNALYFEETESGSGEYHLYGPAESDQDHVIHTTPAILRGDGSTRSFTFPLGSPPVTWTVNNFFVGPAAMGHWSNPNDPSQDEGTFVAQAGGTTVADPVEDASAASA